MNKPKILIFGNLLVKKDSLPLKILSKLKEQFPQIQFIEIDSTENLQQHGKDLKIIDTIENIEKVQTIKISSLEDFKKLQTNKIYTMHDFDLGYNLKLLKKINLINTVEIIGIPQNLDEQQALNQTQLILRK
tara:strand:+ start:3217 stop:3612 length:396 start_codon:yes stop_codon:yes gene_type:complete